MFCQKKPCADTHQSWTHKWGCLAPSEPGVLLWSLASIREVAGLYTLWQFNVAIENGPFIVIYPLTMVDLPIATLVYQRVCINKCHTINLNTSVAPRASLAFGPKAESYNFRQSLSLLRVPTHVQIWWKGLKSTFESAIRIKNSSANLRWKARFYKHMRYNLYNTWISFMKQQC